jgi:hypothetical protein
MRALPETVLEKRSLSGALIFSEGLGAGLGWRLVVVAGRVIAATEGSLVSLALDGSGRVEETRFGARGLAAFGGELAVGTFGSTGAITRVDPVTLSARGELAAVGAPIHTLARVTDEVLASSDSDGRILLHEGGTSRELAKRAHAMVSIGVLRGGSMAAASLAKTIYVFHPQGGKRVWEGLTSIPYALAAHDDVVAAGVGKRVWLASAASTDAPRLLAAHEGIVSAVAFDADGTLRSGGEEGWIHVWPPTARGHGPEPAASIPGRGEIRAITVADDALFVLRQRSSHPV